MLVYFNNRNIIKLPNKYTTSEGFEAINQVVLDGISENMAYLVQSSKYGETNTTDTTSCCCCFRSPGPRPCPNYEVVEFQPRTLDNSAP